MTGAGTKWENRLDINRKANEITWPETEIDSFILFSESIIQYLLKANALFGIERKLSKIFYISNNSKKCLFV